MPPAPHEYRGVPAVLGFLEASPSWHPDRHLHLVAAAANNQPAYACYLSEPGNPTAAPAGLLMLTVRGERIAGLTRFLDSDALIRAGLLQPALVLTDFG